MEKNMKQVALVLVIAWTTASVLGGLMFSSFMHNAFYEGVAYFITSVAFYLAFWVFMRKINLVVEITPK